MQHILVPLEINSAHPSSASLIRVYGGQTMGTTWQVRLVDERQAEPPDWQAGIQAQLDLVVDEMSHWDAHSVLSTYNRAEADSWHDLPPAFAEVMACALSIAEDSAGAYEPNAGALVNVWGFGPAGRHDQAGFVLPDDRQRNAALAVSGWQRLRFDPVARRLLQPGGAQLDLSSIAKGYAVDLVARYLMAEGLRHFLIEVGGELYGAGMKRDGQPWWVGLETPVSDLVPDTLAALHDLAVASSGDYRKFFEIDGVRHAHTVDPRSGYPLRNGLASVTVLDRSCMRADALSTALMVMGPQAGADWAIERNIAARFLLRDGIDYREVVTPAYTAMLQA